MDHTTQHGQKFAILLLASSILIAGLLVGGAIITRETAPSDNGAYQQPSRQQVVQPQRTSGQVPSCGI